MPWKDKTVERLREEFVTAAQEAENFSQLCREYGISRPTGYKWIERSKAGNPLCDRSHAPHRVPHKTGEEVEGLILQVRAENPGWGAKTIVKVLENRGYSNLPSIKTANNILKRNGCIEKAESLKRQAFQRFAREHCNELWQTDFKEDFALRDGSRCYPLTILDDCSRYSIRIDCKQNTLGVKESFEAVFREYGLPKAILSDNGSQFAGFKGGYTQFERWLMDLDVCPIHGRPMHPQTQGKIERFHRTMKYELLKYQDFADLQQANVTIQAWRTKYNEVRPHEALGMRCPAQVYQRSEREYPQRIPGYEYSGVYPLVRVNNWGYLRFGPIRIYLSETMANTRLEIRAREEDLFEVYYRNYRIAQIDACTGRLLNRRIHRAP